MPSAYSRGSINACGKAVANRLCWYQMWEGAETVARVLAGVTNSSQVFL